MFKREWGQPGAAVEQLEEPVLLEAIRVASAAMVLFGLLMAGPIFA